MDEYNNIQEASEKMIAKAMSGDYRYLHLAEDLNNTIEFFQENYYESEEWIEHEKTVEAKIKELKTLRKEKFETEMQDAEYKLAKKQIKALEGLLL
ncbi:MAG: hypothetical protein SVK08_01240 [Halobacteriota archaeon]|nr:hypothetical protein [Halobacteriota archaeon]